MKPYGIDVFSLLMDSNDDTFNSIVNSFVGIAAVQVCNSVLNLNTVIFSYY